MGVSLLIIIPIIICISIYTIGFSIFTLKENNKLGAFTLLLLDLIYLITPFFTLFIFILKVLNTTFYSLYEKKTAVTLNFDNVTAKITLNIISLGDIVQSIISLLSTYNMFVSMHIYYQKT